MDNLILRMLFNRTRTSLSRLFDDASTGCIRIDALDDMAYTVIRALQDGGVHPWLVAVHAHASQDAVLHSMHVASLAANLGHHLGRPIAECVALVQAGLLHDIGKARIPPAILTKPGALTPDETALMRTHAALGHQILLASGMRDPIVLSMARHHHELLDGSGYPDRLAGEAIADRVRLITVCDIYAALTERRPYRPAMARADALEILRGMAPARLDATLVAAFEASLADPSAMERMAALAPSIPGTDRATTIGLGSTEDSRG